MYYELKRKAEKEIKMDTWCTKELEWKMRKPFYTYVQKLQYHIKFRCDRLFGFLNSCMSCLHFISQVSCKHYYIHVWTECGQWLCIQLWGGHSDGQQWGGDNIAADHEHLLPQEPAGRCHDWAVPLTPRALPHLLWEVKHNFTSYSPLDKIGWERLLFCAISVCSVHLVNEDFR